MVLIEDYKWIRNRGRKTLPVKNANEAVLVKYRDGRTEVLCFQELDATESFAILNDDDDIMKFIVLPGCNWGWYNNDNHGSFDFLSRYTTMMALVEHSNDVMRLYCGTPYDLTPIASHVVAYGLPENYNLQPSNDSLRSLPAIHANNLIPSTKVLYLTRAGDHGTALVKNLFWGECGNATIVSFNVEGEV